MGRKVPINLTLSDYEYPPDREALEQLRSTRGISQAVKEHIKNVAEPSLNGFLNGQGLKISHKQLPKFYELIAETANILDVSIPQVYILQDPHLNAYTFGTENQNVVIVTHSLYEQLNECQLSFVLGHEMGHIKSEHVLYSSIMRGHIDNNTPFPHNLEMAVLGWSRKSEVTADRAGLIACQNMDEAGRVLLTLSIGSVKLAQQVDIQEYLESQILSLEFNPVGSENQRYQEHYFIPLRIRKLMEFAGSDMYKRIIGRSLDLAPAKAMQINIELK